jgi:hypothetical protein
MPRPSKQSADWDYTVKQVKLMTPDGHFSGLYGNQREDTHQVLGATSDQYGLIQNSELFAMAIEAMAKRGMSDFEQRVMVGGDGRRVYGDFVFKNKQLANAVGDIFGYKLTVKNSFDRTIRAAVELGFMRLTCLNGASTLEKDIDATQKHSGKVSVQFLAEAIDKAVARGPEALKVYDAMSNAGISDEQGLNILAHLVENKILSDTLRESITTLWLAPRRDEDKARNLYNLYNAVTEHLTHKVESERYEYAQKTNHNVLFSLVNAARNKEKLSKLILPVPTQPKTVIVAQGPVIDVDVVPVPAS